MAASISRTLAVCMWLLLLPAAGRASRQDLDGEEASAGVASRRWVRLASLPMGAPSPSPHLHGVARYMCGQGAWEGDETWESVIGRHADHWGGVTLKITAASAEKEHSMEIVWRQPPTSSACLHDGDGRRTRGQRGLGGLELLEVRAWEGQASPILVAVANQWPYSAVFETILAGRSHSVEVFVCSGCAMLSTLWPALQDACVNRDDGSASSSPAEKDTQTFDVTQDLGASSRAGARQEHAFVVQRICRGVATRQRLLADTVSPGGADAAAAGSRERLALTDAERFFGVMWEYMRPNQFIAHRQRTLTHLERVYTAGATDAVTDPVFLLLVGHYIVVAPATLTASAQARAVRTAVRLLGEEGNGEGLWIEALTAESQRHIADGRARHGLRSLARASSAMPAAGTRAKEGLFINAAVGVARMFTYGQAESSTRVHNGIHNLAALLAPTWARSVEVSLTGSMRVRIATEALLIGGCFGGDGVFGDGHAADPSEVQLVHERILRQADPSSDLLGTQPSDMLVLIDVGANTGCFTLMAVDPPALRVLAFEPIAHTHRILRANLGLNALEHRVATFPVALSNRSHKAIMCNMGQAGASGMSRLGHDSPGPAADAAGSSWGECDLPEEVQLETLDGICEREGVDRVHFLKVDAEGSELSVLEGARGIIERDKPEIWVEVPPEEGAAGPLSQFLHSLGYLPGERVYSSANLLFVPRA